MVAKEPAYKTRQDVADVISTKGDVWDALHGGYLNPVDMPDEELREAAGYLVDSSIIFAYFEELFLSHIPEVEPI